MTMPSRVALPIAGNSVVPLAVCANESNIERWLAGFRLDAFVHHHAAIVLAGIPASVRDDLMSDPSFHMCDYEPGAGVTMQVAMRLPEKNRASRPRSSNAR